jgi:DsbC/DsbD-like thiol-disulfide interchange protein
MKYLILFLTALSFSLTANSQILKPVKWGYVAKKTSATEATVYLKASIEDGWHIYSQYVASGGPVKTSFAFDPAKTYKLVGKTIEPKAIVNFEPNFSMNVGYFEKSVIFQQKIKLTGKTAIVKGSLEFMVCDDTQCLPPETINFSIPVK